MITTERIIKSGLFFHDGPPGDGRQDSLFEDRVLLDADFFEQLRQHPVPLQDAAIHELKDSSAALDIYIWLAYRLHHLMSIQDHVELGESVVISLSLLRVARAMGSG